MRNFKVIFIIAWFLCAQKAMADIYVEPYLDYGFGTINTSLGSYSLSGPYYGSKFGLEYDGFAFGLDLMLANGVTFNSNSYSGQDFGLFVQYTMFIQMSFSYFWDARLANSNQAIAGTGYKLGIAYPLIPYLDLDLDYLAEQHSTIAAGSTNYSNYGDYTSTFLVGLSVPFSF